MRCIFGKGKQRELLIFAKTALDITWRNMAHTLGVGYTTLRDWRDEKYSMQYGVFTKLVEMCPQCDTFREFITRVKEEQWGRKLGGRRTKQRKRGFFDPQYAKQSVSWKSTGGKVGLKRWHAMMKIERTLEYHRMQYEKIKQSLKYRHEYWGQKYRNELEVEVAKNLTQNGFKFEYERLLQCGDKFYFPDFVVDGTIIECTYWDDTEQRARELSQKIKNYLRPNLKTILIVTKQQYKEIYSKLLQNLNVRVITPDNLREVLGGK